MAVALLAVVGAAPAGSATKPVVFNVGDTQGIDSMNPIVGVTVPAYEAWNIQYATLTDKSPKDFSTIPGLAKSWKGSADGRTWTYTLRPNLKWSDGQPLTSEDIAYTVNRARKEEWLNYTSVVANLTATAPDPTTVVITSSVSDPKLPTMDVYIVPKHVFEKQDAKAVTKYDALDGVGSGPFVLEHFEKGQFARFRANPYYYGGKSPISRVVLRKFDNPDAMVAALKRGEIDAAEDVPGAAFHQLEKNPSFVTVQGNQGAMEEFAINGGAGLKKPHPALLDLRVRQAIATRSTSRRSSSACSRAWAPRPTRRACRPTPRGRRRWATASATTSTSPRPGRSSTTRATRTPTATGYARCPGAGAR
jgi:peptide/nickel transport system substrate-binding protein